MILYSYNIMMVLATLLTILAVQTPTHNARAEALKLGRERASYGDIPNSGLWKHGDTGQFGGAYIFFRAGSSTERYYLTAAADSDKWRISRTTRIGGKIRKDWMIFVQNGNETRLQKPGSLWLWSQEMAGRGRIIGSIPKTAQKDLESQVPLALYRFNTQLSYYNYVNAIGKQSKSEYWDTENNKLKPPKTAKPYPVTDMEIEYMKKKRTAPIGAPNKK